MPDAQSTVNPQSLRYELMLRNLNEIITSTRRDLQELWSIRESLPHLNRAHLIAETHNNLDFFLRYRDEVEDAYAKSE